MNCLDFLRRKQAEGELDQNIDLSDENVEVTTAVPVHRDLWTLIFHQKCNGTDITGNITSGNAVIAWVSGDGKVHTSDSDNHFIESKDSGESES
ncbi:hypothetical protein ABXV18_24525 [Vibrio owensii]|uniref:hypothetical protein n=1 Tax=Vibrio owensii TaxID=696485 RepID=UPI0033961558